MSPQGCCKWVSSTFPRIPCIIFAVVFGKRYGTAAQIACKGREPLAFVSGDALIIGGGDTGYKKGLVDIHPAADRINDFENNTSPRNSSCGSRQGLDAH
jgi:hypothetical protein